MSFLSFIRGFFNKSYKPLPDQLWQIELEPYRYPENCCSHKSAKYAGLLNDAGIRANVVVGTVSGGKPHAWVQVIHPEKGTVHWIDPTFPDNRDGYIINKYPQRVLWLVFKEGITGHEVFTYQGIIKIHLKNIPNTYKNYFKNQNLK